VDIKVKGAIETLDADQTLQACYDDPGFPSSICENFTRDADGQITFIQTGFANAAQRDFQGVIAELAWNIRTPFLGANSTFNIGVNYLYNDKLQVRVGQGDLTTLRRSIGYSKHQATTNLTYRNEGFRAQLQAQYIGPALFDPDEEPDNREFRGVGDVVFLNTSVSYDINDRFSVRFIVDNLWIRSHRSRRRAGWSRDVLRRILGRYFKAGASVKF
jgi:outer membrane cobalamin receptor